MSQSWYIQLDGRAVGPLTAGQLKQLAKGNRIARTSKVRRGTDGKWVEAEKIRGLMPASAKSDSKPQTKGRTANDQPRRTQPIDNHAAHPYRPPASGHRSTQSGHANLQQSSPRELRDAFQTIWFAPRETIRWAINERQASHAILLAMFAFGLRYVDNCLLTEEGALVSPAILFAPIGIPISAVLGLLPLYILGFAFHLVGKLLGGKGDRPDLRTAVAWGLVPWMFTLPVSLLWVSSLWLVPSLISVPSLLLNLPYLVIFLWSIIVHVAGISAAHQFSEARAAATFVLGIALVFITFFIFLMIATLLLVIITPLMGCLLPTVFLC